MILRLAWCNADVPNLLFEEGLLRLGVLSRVLLERLVLDQGHVGGQHHERLGLLVLVLSGTRPANQNVAPLIQLK